MKKTVIALAFVAALVVGVLFGGILALNKNFNSYQASSQASNESSAPVTETTKTEANTPKEEKVQESKPKTVSNSKPKEAVNNQKPKPKDYEEYYFINDFIENGSKKYLALDMIYAYKDSSYASGYRIVNNNEKLRTYKISSEAKFYVLDYDYNGYLISRRVDFEDFRFASYNGVYGQIVNDIKIRNDEIVEIRQLDI